MSNRMYNKQQCLDDLFSKGVKYFKRLNRKTGEETIDYYTLAIQRGSLGIKSLGKLSFLVNTFEYKVRWIGGI